MVNNLPDWVVLPLTQIAKDEKFSIVDGPFGSDLKLSDYVEGGQVPVLTTKNLNGKFDPQEVRYITKEKFEQVKRSKIVPGDILIAKIGSVGKCSIYPEGAPIAIIPANLCKISVNEQLVNRSFLLYQFKSYEFQNKIAEITSATAQPAFSVKRLKTLSATIPPLNEQRRIVAKLEKLLAKVDACKERLENIPAILKRFRQSVLAAACSGRLTADWRISGGKKLTPPKFETYNDSSNTELPPTWNSVRSADLFSFVTSGSRGWARYYSNEGPLFVRVGNLSHETIALDLRSVQRVGPPAGAEGLRTRVLPNDILISITADVGMVALASHDVQEAYINQHVALARPKSGFCANYVAWYLSSSEGGLKQFLEMQRGATKVGLGLDDIKNVLVPMPPLEEQYEIVRRVEALFKIADGIEQRYEKASAHVDKLTQSILAKAFRGELVPQDPDDEPAAELLKRIQAERKKQADAGGPGRRGSKRRVKTISSKL